jgi:hypothetical protein
MGAGAVSLTLGWDTQGRPAGAEGDVPKPGPFRIDGLEAGSYRVLASARASDGVTRLFANKSVELTRNSVDDLALELLPGVSLRAVVKMEDDKESPPARFNVLPVSQDGWGPIDLGPPGASATAFSNLPRGRYSFAGMRIPGHAVVSMSLNGTPIEPGSDAILESPDSVLTIVLTTELGNISGVVRDASQQPVADAEVALVAMPAAMENTVTSDANGRFTFNGLAPGGYKLFVVGNTERRRIPGRAALLDRVKLAELIVVKPHETANIELHAGN